MSTWLKFHINAEKSQFGTLKITLSQLCMEQLSRSQTSCYDTEQKYSPFGCNMHASIINKYHMKLTIWRSVYHLPFIVICYGIRLAIHHNKLATGGELTR